MTATPRSRASCRVAAWSGPLLSSEYCTCAAASGTPRSSRYLRPPPLLSHRSRRFPIRSTSS